MLTDDADSPLSLFFDDEAEGVRIQPGIRQGEISVEFIQDHFIYGAVFERKTYFDFIKFGALEWLQKQHTALKQENQDLKDKVAQLERTVWGTSSEQLPAPGEPSVASESEESTAVSNVVALPKREHSRSGGRKPLPENLPRETVTHDLPDHEKFCPCCHGAVRYIDDEVTEQATVIPAQYKVIRSVRKKYVCNRCGVFKTAPGKKSLIEKSSYSNDFVAHVACSKYQFGLPFYRQQLIFEQSALPFNRTTLANLMIGCAERLLPLYLVLQQELRSQRVIHADETPIQVLKEPGRKATTQSWLWLYRSRQDSLNQVVLFDYQQTRGGMHPRRFLDIDGDNPYTGYLQVDGYAGYNGLVGVKRIGCMVHVRRKFVDAIKALPSHVTNSPGHQAVDLIGKLYGIERLIKGLPDRERYKVRQEESVPVLNEFKAWLDDLRPKVTPKSPLGKAVGYALSQWDAVSRYVEDGCLAIDNNPAERNVKSVVIGRKNWLFADSVDGAHTNAIMYSLVETAKANGIEPFTYLKYVIDTMPYLKTANEVQGLLPWNTPIPSLSEGRMAA